MTQLCFVQLSVNVSDWSIEACNCNWQHRILHEWNINLNMRRTCTVKKNQRKTTCARENVLQWQTAMLLAGACPWPLAHVCAAASSLWLWIGWAVLEKHPLSCLPATSRSHPFNQPSGSNPSTQITSRSPVGHDEPVQDCEGSCVTPPINLKVDHLGSHRVRKHYLNWKRKENKQTAWMKTKKWIMLLFWSIERKHCQLFDQRFS